MTSRLAMPRGSVACRSDRAVLCACATGPVRAPRRRTSGPTRSGSQARSCISSTVRSATARKATAKATPPRICARGRATSRPASSRSGRRPTGRCRRTRISSTSSGAACPTRRCRPGRTSPTQEVSDIAYFITTFSPDFSNPESVPPGRSTLPSAPKSTKESIEAGKKLYEDNGCVKCHGTLGRGDGPSAPTLKDDWGHPIRPADLAQSWTFRGGSSREDIFRTMSTGLNGTPMPSFADALTPEQRWAITDFIVSLSGSDGPGYTNLVIAKHVAGSDRSDQGSRELRVRSRGALSNRRADHGARARVPSARDERHRSGDLRCRLDRAPRSMARHERGEDGEERAVASGAAGGGGGAGGGGHGEGGAGAAKGNPFGDEEVAPAGPGRSRPRIPSRIERAAAPASEFSDAVAIQIPSQAPTGARKPYFIFGDAQNSVDLWFFDLARPSPAAVHRQGKRGHRAERHGRCHRCRELRPGRMVGHLQAAASRRVGRRVHAGRVPADRLLGLGRVLARARQPARSLALVFALRRARSRPVGRRPDDQDGAPHSRHRAGRDRLGAAASRRSRAAESSAASARQPAATSA